MLWLSIIIADPKIPMIVSDVKFSALKPTAACTSGVHRPKFGALKKELRFLVTPCW